MAFAKSTMAGSRLDYTVGRLRCHRCQKNIPPKRNIRLTTMVLTHKPAGEPTVLDCFHEQKYLDHSPLHTWSTGVLRGHSLSAYPWYLPISEAVSNQQESR